ncbi:MAG: hypothetical protein AAGJ35_08210, partial [Myxococcota bacterium]
LFRKKRPKSFLLKSNFSWSEATDTTSWHSKQKVRFSSTSNDPKTDMSRKKTKKVFHHALQMA